MWRRAGSGILTLVLALCAWAFISGAIGLADAIPCGEASPAVKSLTTGKDLECFEGTDWQRKASVALWAASGVALAAAALAAFGFAIGGRWGRPLARLIMGALALAAVAVIVAIV